MPILVLLALLLSAPIAAAEQSVREVTVQPRTVVSVSTRLRYTTMIVLPETEQILDFVCGDKDYWVVSGTEHIAYVKPAKAGASTNLNLVTATGRVYSFLLTEGGSDPDLNLYVIPDPSEDASPRRVSRFVPAAQLEELQGELTLARQDAHSAHESTSAAAEKAIDDFRARYPLQIRFPYRFEGGKKPFYVSAIFHDGTFTYLRTAARELPSLYELRDGKPSLVNFQVHDGLYVVPKVLDRGYLAIGKQRFDFRSTEK